MRLTGWPEPGDAADRLAPRRLYCPTMMPEPPGPAGHAPRIPDRVLWTAPSRRELAAAVATGLLAAQALVVPVTALLVPLLALTGRLCRWRPHWLALPAAVGLGWALDVGVPRALSGYLVLTHPVLAAIAGPGDLLGRAAHLTLALRAWPGPITGQLPVALLAAAAQVLGYRLTGRLTGAGAGPPPRSGAVLAIRARYLAAELRRGQVATRDGGCVGVSGRTGRRVAISWPEAAGGVLCTGRDPAAVAAVGAGLALAAVAHRKAVVVVDLAGFGDPVTAVAAAAGGVAAPLRVFSADGPGCYDPFAGTDPERAVRLARALIDWPCVAVGQRRLCAQYLSAAVRHLTATGPRRPRTGLLADLGPLLGRDGPAALCGADRGPMDREGSSLAGDAPVSDALAALAAMAAADPAALDSLATAIDRLRGSAVGCWLRPARPGPHGRSAAGSGGLDQPIALSRVLAGREVLVFRLDRPADPAASAAVARLVTADLTAELGDRDEASGRADCLVWISGCEVVPVAALADLGGACRRSGAALVLGTADGQCAAGLAHLAGVLVVRGTAPAGLGPGILGPGSLGTGAPGAGVPAHGTGAPGQEPGGSLVSGAEMPDPGPGAGPVPGPGVPEIVLPARGTPGCPAPGAGAPGQADGGGWSPELLAPRPRSALAVQVRAPRPWLRTDVWAVR
jgi:hypothetical protein